MTLRRRLTVASTIQLLAVGVVFATLYLKIQGTVLPEMTEHLRAKTLQAARSLGAKLDVPLGAADRALVIDALDAQLDDPELAFLEVQDAEGATVFRRGRPPSAAIWRHPVGEVHDQEASVAAWTPVSIEGLDLGRVLIGYGTGRIVHLQAWLHALGTIALAVWVAVIVYAWRFSGVFVSPIRHMMEFSRTVAGGTFDRTLACAATGELGPLVANLNGMARELQTRERERVAHAERTEAMQAELRDVSRLAGMAEIATGVLHNVGNVLNSLNVSVATVGERLRASRAASLERGVGLYRAHPGGLVGFLGTEKGRLFPEFLAVTAARLVEENAALRRELDAAERSIDHIKTIVAAQQGYSRAAGAREGVDLVAVVDHALELAQASTPGAHVDVVRAYGDVPELQSDPHKILQILVNLVANARQALAHMPEGSVRRLEVRIDRAEAGVVVVVRDTGCGIEAGDLARVFEHGFTTRPDGHGFGLHASANSARELGGSLSAASAGRDQGATFTVTLPIERDQEVSERAA